ncbi:putative transporter [Vibrio hippocampi]|uniref:Peptide antibiotic transporter SbmA n=1 Tax=Vibrio hippocampi TaxID=654686 RepID=A0ABM8ZKY3_9VIBR|nr:putative transporter [Vibrio hippocampi]CAH0528912.1 Peptide antibiotic transporter SbmA [Vibrio hippocampi]
MFRSFFLNKQWFAWSWIGSAVILLATWYKVQLDVQVNEWFGDFYNSIQQALTSPGEVTAGDLYAHLFTFIKISIIFVVVAILLEFFMRHYVFRWRTAMHHFYMQHWSKLRHIEGASQRVQEDTMRFANIVERLGVSFLRSFMTLLAFQPLLWELSKQVKTVPYFGEVEHVLIYAAILSALFGTVLLAAVGVKLPGLEFNNQKAEAALRKELVLGEDNEQRAQPQSMKELFSHVRTNYVTMYRHYLYFDLFKISFLQMSAILPYILLTPTIIAGLITFGTMQQIIRAFNKVEGSLHYLVFSWSTIVELISVYKRLKAFEQQIDEQDTQQEVDYAQ